MPIWGKGKLCFVYQSNSYRPDFLPAGKSIYTKLFKDPLYSAAFILPRIPSSTPDAG